MFHYYILTFCSLTFGDEGIRILGLHVLNHFSKTLKAESSFYSSERPLNIVWTLVNVLIKRE